ncbi:MAG: hypothetical protein FWH10_08575 [Oscillospiraceae bacterium]|nr:hypothetical protein [Oscillospiraceae bacterium]
MSADFTYRGIPVTENGIVKYVRRARSIKAPDGIYYRGVLSTDSRGNSFVYNQYPNTGISPIFIPIIWDDLNIWNDVNIWNDTEVII